VGKIRGPYTAGGLSSSQINFFFPLFGSWEGSLVSSIRPVFFLSSVPLVHYLFGLYGVGVNGARPGVRGHNFILF
jgi:hypothetical protein